MSGSSKNQLSHLRLIVLTVIGFILVTLAACGSTGTEEQQERTGKASAKTGTTDTTAGATTGAAAMGGEMETTGMEGGMGGMAAPDNVPRLPPVKAYYEGEEVFFVHPEVSDKETADLLTNMMGSPVLVVPELADVPEEALAGVYAFTNGVKGDGPFNFQPDVFDSAPGDEGYSPLRQLYLVTWQNEAEARELKSMREVQEARQEGLITIEKQDVVINEPFLTWPGGQR